MVEEETKMSMSSISVVRTPKILTTPVSGSGTSSDNVRECYGSFAWASYGTEDAQPRLSSIELKAKQARRWAEQMAMSIFHGFEKRAASSHDYSVFPVSI